MLIGIVAFVVIMMIIGAIIGGEEDGGSTRQGPDPTPIPPPSITAIQLYEEREANATRFDLNYKGTWVRVTGTVGRIDSGEVHLVVDMESYRVLGEIFLEYIALHDLPKEDQARANRGQDFTATCKVSSYILGTMNLRDCKP